MWKVIIIGVVLTVSTVTSAKGLETENDFKTAVVAYFEKHCYSCHSYDTQKAKLNLEKVPQNVAATEIEAVWRLIYSQIKLDEMPPKKKTRPQSKETEGITSWIEKQFLLKGESLAPALNKTKLEPASGNYVDHKKLFDGQITDKSFTPARLWRVSSAIYVKTNRSLRGVPPFSLLKEGEFRDYADLLFAEGNGLDSLLANSENYIDATLGVLGKGNQPYFKGIDLCRALARQEEDRKKKRNVRNVTPEAALSQAFVHFFYRSPTDKELAKYAKLYKDIDAESGSLLAVRELLIVMMISPNSIYRVELGNHEIDEYGRRFLSPIECAMAIAYALGDSKPDEVLLKAARTGKLNNKVDVEREVRRILSVKMDKLFHVSLNGWRGVKGMCFGGGFSGRRRPRSTPRIIRFFEEYFGYQNVTKVFKDKERSKNGHAPEELLHDTDYLLKYILKADKDVFRQLLTTNKAFIKYGPFGDHSYVAAPRQIDKLLNDKKLSEKERQFKLGEAKRTIGFGKDVEAINNNDSLSLEDKWKTLDILRKTYARQRYDRHVAFIKNNDTLSDKQKEVTVKKYHESFFKRQANYAFVYDVDKTDPFWFTGQQPFKMIKGRRAGILTQPSWLVSFSNNFHNDPVKRGKWVREKLLAGKVPDIPIAVDAKIPDDPHRTLRQRFSVTEAGECWKCHKKMNPLGYTFEMYDDFGRYRDAEDLNDWKQKQHDPKLMVPVDATGQITLTIDDALNGDVKNAVEMLHKIANSDLGRQSFLRHVFRFWMGRNEMLSDSQTLIQMDRDYLTSGGSFQELLVSLLTSDSFLYRK